MALITKPHYSSHLIILINNNSPNDRSFWPTFLDHLILIHAEYILAMHLEALLGFFPVDEFQIQIFQFLLTLKSSI